MILSYKNWLFVFGILFAIFTLNIEITAINLALVPMAKTFGIGLADTQWFITIMLLSFGAFIVMAGRLGDIYGHYRISCIGLWIFIIGAIICAVSIYTWQIIAGRLIQGIGGAFCWSNLVTLIFEIFPKEKKGLASGLPAGITGIALAAGPLIGGVLTQMINWRWIFWIDIPLILISLIIMAAFKPEVKKQKSKESIDFVGILLMSTSIICLLLGINNLSSPHLAVLCIILFVCAILFGVLFYYFEKKTKSPLIDFSLLKKYPPVLIGCLGRFLALSIFYILLYLLGLFLEHYHHLTPVSAGINLLPMTLLVGLISPVGGIIVDKLGVLKPIKIGFFCYVISCFFLLLFAFCGSWILFYLALLIFGVGFSCNSPALLAFTLRDVPEKSKGIVSGIYFMGSLLAGSIGLAFAGLILQFNLSKQHQVQDYFKSAFIETILLCLALGLMGYLLFFILSKSKKIHSN